MTQQPSDRRSCAIDGKRKAFIKGAALIAAAGFIVKLLGAFYRIPLTYMISTYGMGISSAAIHIFIAASQMASSGVPQAEAVLIARARRSGRIDVESSVYSGAGRLLLITGSIASILTLLFAKRLALWMEAPDAVRAVQAAAPAVLLFSLTEWKRALLRGRGKLGSIALMQSLEQLVRVGAGLLLAYIFVKNGMSGAVGSILGLSASMLAAYIMQSIASGSGSLPEPPARLVKKASLELLKMSYPMTVGACAMPIASVLESAMLVPRLGAAGIAPAKALALYGLYTGTVMAAGTLPLLAASSLSTSLLPLVASAGNSASKRISQALSAALISIPTLTIAVFALAELFTRLFCPSFDNGERLLAEGLLRVSLLSSIPQGLHLTALTSLQSMGKPKHAMAAQLITAAVRVSLLSLLLAEPGVGIYALPLSSLASSCAALFIELLMLNKITGRSVLPPLELVRAAFALAAALFTVYSLRSAFGYAIIISLPTALAGAIVYLILVTVLPLRQGG